MEAVRPAGGADVSARAAILNAWIDARDRMARRHTPGEVAALCRDVAFARRSVRVIGRPVEGGVALVPEDGRAGALCVAAPGRGTGRAFPDVAKAQRERLDLWTFAAGEGAGRVHRREGFREVRRTAGEKEDGLPDAKPERERRT